MADFDITTYPLAGATSNADDLTVARDLMDDGTMGVRSLGSDTFREFTLVFEHMDEQTSSEFGSYLITNKIVELDVVLGFMSPNETWRGYIWGQPTAIVEEGVWWIWTVPFRGKKV